MTHRSVVTVFVVALMSAQTAFAQDAAPAAPLQPLAPGQAAGLQAAQNGPNLNKVALVAGIGLGVLAVYLVLGTHYNLPKQSASASGTK